MSKTLLITLIIADEAREFQTTQEYQWERREELSHLSREHLIQIYRERCIEKAVANG